MKLSPPLRILYKRTPLIDFDILFNACKPCAEVHDRTVYQHKAFEKTGDLNKKTTQAKK